jgi:hypothetical protein
VTMKLLDSGGGELAGTAKYSAGGWQQFGSGTTTTTMELLPNNIRFRIEFGGAAKEKYQDVASDPNVLFTYIGGVLARQNLLADGWELDETWTSPVPAEFSLGQNYPNPFNPSTTLRYALPVDAVVTLEVYNILGERVAQLVNGPVAAGYHEVVFSAANLPSGVYFYRISAVANGSEFSQIEKMMLLK